MGLKVKIKKGVDADKRLIFEAYDEYIEEKLVMGKSQSTIDNYNTSFKVFCEFNEFDEESLTEEITRSEIYHWIGTMKNEGKKHTTINHYLRDIRAFLYWCMHEDRQYIVPAFKVEMVDGQEPPPRLFDDEDIEKLLIKPKSNASFVEWRSWAVVNFVLGTSARAKSICSICMGDIDFKNKTINLPHTKNKKMLVVPLSAALETVLKEYIRVWRSKAPKDSYLFCNISEEQLTTNAQRQAFKEYALSRGCNQYNIHGLRHNFASIWIRNDGNRYQLQEIMGHRSPTMTQRYVKLEAQDLKRGFEQHSALDIVKKGARRTQTVKRSR